MYRIDPKIKAAKKWHKLLNNGYRFALVNAAGEIVRAARFEYELKVIKKYQPQLKQLNIADQV